MFRRKILPVVLLQHRPILDQQRDELAPYLSQAGVSRAPAFVPCAREPALHARLFHRRGKGFVEQGVVLHVELLVREFVKQEARKLAFGIMDKSTEDRVVEPSQGRVSRHAADIYIVAALAQHGTRGVGIGLAEVAAIADAAGNGKAGGDRHDRKLRRGEYIPKRVAPPQIGVAPVAAVVRQRELATGELAYAQHRAQLGLERGRQIVAAQFLVYGRGAAQQIQMPEHGLGIITQRGAAAEQGRKRGEQQ